MESGQKSGKALLSIATDGKAFGSPTEDLVHFNIFEHEYMKKEDFVVSKTANLEAMIVILIIKSSSLIQIIFFSNISFPFFYFLIK